MEIQDVLGRVLTMFQDLIIDGFASLEGGCDTGRVPTLLARNQTALSVNADHRGGFIQQRPGFKLRRLVYDSPDFLGPMATGVFQCAGIYKGESGRTAIAVLLAGRLFMIYPESNFRMREVTPSSPIGLRWNPRLFDGWLCQAGPYLLAQNGQDMPLIFDGSSCRYAAANEIKTGRAMIYVQGRVWYALPDGFSFRAGDLIYGDGLASSVLKETENNFLNEGGDFAVPRATGPITALEAPGILDTSLGQGALQVFTEGAIYGVNTPIDRTTWKNVNYPLVTTSQLHFGAVGPRAVASVNGDLFYRAMDGIRSFALARRDFASWSNVPISREMNGIFKADASVLLGACSCVLWHNRLLVTCSPQHSDFGIKHRGLAILDFDPLGTMAGRSPPAWQGLWTGLDIFQIVAGRFGDVERCFVFARDRLALTEHTELWEILEEENHDTNSTGSKSITWSFDTPSYGFGDPFNYKRLEGAELYADRLSGTVVFSSKFRTDGYPGWTDWTQWSDCATVESCPPSLGCLTVQNMNTQHRPRTTFPQPPDVCDGTAGKPLRDFWTMQTKVQVTGAARIRALRFGAKPLPTPPFQCPTGLPCAALDVCVGSPFGYQTDA